RPVEPKVTGPEPTAPIPPRVKISPPPEVSLPKEELPLRQQLALKILIDLGATGLSENISLSKIKKNYRQLAKRYHPDQASGEPGSIDTMSFIRLQQAYESLEGHLRELNDQSGQKSAA
ncbi:MAG: J domain-containing protein, partial [Bdellovibrionales bacterium]